MGKIQVLSFEVANLIAAGEVVDRPASAIKEMMENAIDAGAKHITVEIQNGGVSFMRVTDDGCGMSAEDLPMAVRRHATSKIRSAEDLDGIATLGFRGEALAAISSVSDMRIMSKRREDEVGAMLEIRGGAVMGVTERGCRDGTTIIVENLFSNVPARRKFLKRDATEAMAVSAHVERVALSHPEIAVRLISDGTQKLETAGDGQLMSAIWAVFGKDFASRLIPVDGEHDGIRISGFIGRSDNVRSNRNGQTFFINGRYVRSRTAQAALEQAFTSYIAPEKYPVCVLNIELNPMRVDVNVHPAKLEVKFSNEKPVFEAIYYTVRQANEANVTRPAMTPVAGKNPFAGNGRVSDATMPIETERPESLGKRQIGMDLSSTVVRPAPSFTPTPPPPPPVQPSAFGTVRVEGQKPPQERITAEEYVARYVEARSGAAARTSAVADVPKGQSLPERQVMHAPTAPLSVMGTTPPADDTVGQAPPAPRPPQAADVAAPPPPEPEVTPIPDTVPAPASEPLASHPEPAQPYRMVGEVFHSYVIVEQGDRMLLIDKHAAHERLIFEQLKARLRDREIDSQLLMLPIEVMLMSDEVGLLDAYRDELERIGFTFTCLRNTVRVDSIPSGIQPAAVPDMFAIFAEQLRDGSGTAKLTRDILFEKALYQASCKAAIKAGRDYPTEHIAWLVDQLMTIPDITFCPHGRPVAMEMKKRHIDHQFERC